MSLWSSNVAASSNAPLFTLLANLPANSVNITALFNNVNISVVPGMGVGLFGVSTLQAQTSQSNASHYKNNVDPSWALVRFGMGGIVNTAINFAGNTYGNGMLVNFTTTKGSNGQAVISTNAAGAITGLSLVKTGSFVNSSSVTVAYANSTNGTTGIATGANVANVSAILGGRANRWSIETLVVLPSAVANTSNSAFFPNT